VNGFDTDIDVRETHPDEFRRAANTFTRALMFPPPTDEQWAERLATWNDMVSFSAWDGDRCVGHAGQFALATMVPGAPASPPERCRGSGSWQHIGGAEWRPD